MIDTLKLKSPYISEELASAVEQKLVLRTAVDNATGVELYAISSGSLEGSYASTVAVNVCRRDWQRLSVPQFIDRKGAMVEFLESPPYLTIEGSVHKAMLGHNCFGGSENLQAQVHWFVSDLGRRLGVELPDASEWVVQRVDTSEVYDLGSFEGVQEYIRGLSFARYPRRKVNRYGCESVMFMGNTTTLKFYHKGPEFGKHDKKRLAEIFGEAYTTELHLTANSLLRVEVTIKAQKIKADYGDDVTIERIGPNWAGEIYDREVGKVLREGRAEMEKVRTNDAVHDRLYDVYEDRLASVLYGTWLKFSAQGEDRVRGSMKRSTFYLHRKQLADAGVSWNGTDVYVASGVLAFPESFSPVRSDPRRLVGEDVHVTIQLLPWKVAV